MIATLYKLLLNVFKNYGVEGRLIPLSVVKSMLFDYKENIFNIVCSIIYIIFSEIFFLDQEAFSIFIV